VNIAGTFNGVLNMNEDVNEITVDKDGKPSRMNQPYQQLRVLKASSFIFKTPLNVPAIFTCLFNCGNDLSLPYVIIYCALL
jgi:hypothetical protein